MRFELSRAGLYVVFQLANSRKPAIGFKIKPVTQMLFSERYKQRRGFCIGPLYFGLYS
jgi:hypothetical protein